MEHNPLRGSVRSAVATYVDLGRLVRCLFLFLLISRGTCRLLNLQALLRDDLQAQLCAWAVRLFVDGLDVSFLVKTEMKKANFDQL